jgi:catechol 2,3-dioxygenase-like lactoylglutathione lyase family enzyme
MSVSGFDHVAIPTANPEAMLEFYAALGFDCPTIAEYRESRVPFFSICFGDNKINVHTAGLWMNEQFTLRGPSAQPGCGDFCFVWSGDLAALERALGHANAAIEEGPVEREGGRGGGRATGTSIYTRDPDDNLLEFIVYPEPA